MIPPHEKARIRQAVAIAEKLLEELQVGLADMDELGPLTSERLESLTRVERAFLLAFLKRFENAVEGGKGLFRAALNLAAVEVVTMSTHDLLDAAEKEEILGSADEWREVVRARNVVAHEYVMSPTEAAAALENAHIAARTAAELLDGALDAVRRPPMAARLVEDEP